MVVILQAKVVGNNIIEKSKTVILQPKVVCNNALEKGLVNLSVKIQLDGSTKTLIDD